MQTTPNHLLLLHVLGKSFQDYLLHLPRDQGEANRPVVDWILLLDLKNSIDTCFLESSGTSLISLKLWNITESGLTMTGPALSALMVTS